MCYCTEHTFRLAPRSMYRPYSTKIPGLIIQAFDSHQIVENAWMKLLPWITHAQWKVALAIFVANLNENFPLFALI